MEISSGPSLSPCLPFYAASDLADSITRKGGTGEEFQPGLSAKSVFSLLAGLLALPPSVMA